jgi:hypothetical protein
VRASGSAAATAAAPATSAPPSKLPASSEAGVCRRRSWHLASTTRPATPRRAAP